MIDKNNPARTNHGSISNRRRTFLKTAAAGIVGGATLVAPVTASSWHDKLTYMSEELQYSDQDFELEFGTNGYTGVSGNNDLVPFGIVWSIDMPSQSEDVDSYYFVRDLRIDFTEWESNPTYRGRVSSAPVVWDDEEGREEEYPDRIDRLQDAGWTVVESFNKFQPYFDIMNAVNYDGIAHGTYSNGNSEGAYAQWGEDIRGPKHGGMDLHYYMGGKYLDPREGTYWYRISISGDIYRYNSYWGTLSHITEINEGHWFSVTYEY